MLGYAYERPRVRNRTSINYNGGFNVLVSLMLWLDRIFRPQRPDGGRDSYPSCSLHEHNRHNRLFGRVRRTRS